MKSPPPLLSSFSSSHPLHYSFLTLLFIFIFIFTSSTYAQDEEQYRECLETLFNCGPALQGIGYPFWGIGRPHYCGLQEFYLTCHDDHYATINISGRPFRVLDINNKGYRSMTLLLDICFQVFDNTIFNHTLFSYRSTDENVTLFYDCSDIINITDRYTFHCPPNQINGVDRRSFISASPFSPAVTRNIEQCISNMTVPVPTDGIEEFRDNESMGLGDLLNWGFDVEYGYDNMSVCLACEESGGKCWINGTCLCRNHEIHPLVCTNNSGSGSGLNLPRKIVIGVGAAGLSVIIMSIIFFMYHRRNKTRYARTYFTQRNISSNHSSIMDLEKSDTYNGVHIFSYEELQKATNNFDANKELGDGGFGTVYKGKLKDGRVVAVKRLYENNYKRVEQFMNEVVLLTRLRHQNLVALYGCTTHRCRELLLVYEYIPNGTVADHLHGELANPGSLTWATRMSIAIETASALVYLHASDVIHRDVKTNNILLDSNFRVKVADFGLSRLFPTNVTHVSTAPQGTPGYVDPEYHECYQLTSKSDVFSFGVVLIELISSKPAVDITRHRHEINLSNMAINKIRSHALHELVDPCIGFETDYKVRKMIRAVAELAFQCLQNERDMRPSMEQILEELMRIQSTDYDVGKDEDDEFSVDDIGLLKNNVQTLSPDTFSDKWISNSSSSFSEPIG